MVNYERIFDNFFTDKKIINVRLANFTNDCLNRLIQNNPGGSYTPLITLLTPLTAAFDAELGDVATALSGRKATTVSVNNVIDDFCKKMSDLQGVIAHALGGYEVPSFLEFYPQGITEYSKATKPRIPVLISRVKTAAIKHAAILGSTITTELQSFESAFDQARDIQQQMKGSLSENRTDRTTARKNVEDALLKIVFTIGERFPGDVQQCLSFFRF